MEISYDIDIEFKRGTKKKDLNAMKTLMKGALPDLKKTGIVVEEDVGELMAIHGPNITLQAVISKVTHISIQLKNDLEAGRSYANSIMNKITNDVFNDRKELISEIVTSVRFDNDIDKDLVRKYINIKEVDSFRNRTLRQIEPGSVGFETHNGEIREAVIFMTIGKSKSILFSRTETMKQIPIDFVEEMFNKGKSGMQEIIDSEGVKLIAE
ncbi:MAG: hypothetical protein ACYCSG_00990 [Thermoplasmataceae archaeon]